MIRPASSLSLSRVCTLAAACLSLAYSSDSSLTSPETRHHLVDSLTKAHVLDPQRVLVHLSQTCNLLIGGKSYSVLDVRELVTGASFAHGVNQIIILKEPAYVEQSFKYLDQRPLFCSGNQLYVLGNLKVNHVDPGGNVLVFQSPTEQPTYRTVDTNSLPKSVIQ